MTERHWSYFYRTNLGASFTHKYSNESASKPKSQSKKYNKDRECIKLYVENVIKVTPAKRYTVSEENLVDLA